MKTKIILSILALGFIVSALGQNTIELTFTAIDSADYLQPDSIKVVNRTQGGDTILYYPDTVLVLDYQVGISETTIGTDRFQVFQNYPNPVTDKTTITFYIPERDIVNLIVTDISGRKLINTERILDRGYHSYNFTPGKGCLFLFTIQWRNKSSSLKILKTSPVPNNKCELEYLESDDPSLQLKSTVAIQSFPFSLGDELLYIGYKANLESGMLDNPDISKTYTFQFAYNIACPGIPTVQYEGQVYNTVQIFNQCWLKENINAGAMLQGSEEMTNNGILEKYCYSNNPDSCTKYGGLYQWDEMMQYSTQQGTQGICPPGWHLPMDDDWIILEGHVDTQFSVVDTIWNNTGPRGFNAGLNLKSLNYWNSGGNGTDLFNFTALPGGSTNNSGNFVYIGEHSMFWTSSEYTIEDAMGHYIGSSQNSISRGNNHKFYAFSVRCIKD